MLLFLALLVSCVFLHLLAIAASAHLFGVKVRAVCLGYGPSVAQIGVLQLRAIPLGGSVKLLDSRVEPVSADEQRSAFDGQPTAKQIAISLSGCAALALIAFAVLGVTGLQAVGAGMVQILRGAVSPFHEAQTLIAQALKLVATAPPLVLLGYVAAKVAALNLMPLPTYNGGAALAAVGRRLGADHWWQTAATKALWMLALGLFASWFIALLVYSAPSQIVG